MTWEEAKKWLCEGHALANVNWSEGEHIRLVSDKMCFSVPVDKSRKMWNHWFGSYEEVESLSKLLDGWIVV